MKFHFKDVGIIPPKYLEKIEESERDFKRRLKQRSVDAVSSASNFLVFRKYVCGHDTFPHMMEWHHILNTGLDNKYLKGIAGDDVCILSPRNSAKSSFLLQWVAWVIGVHVSLGISLKILYISYVIDTAASKSRQIKSIIESDLYQEVFPKVKKSRAKWGENEWAIDFPFAGLRTIDEPYTLACSGIAGAINSRRAHLLVFDDILKNPSEAKNKKIQDRMVDNLNNIVRFTKYDGTRSVNLGTRMAKHDVYARYFVFPNWQVITQSALLTDELGNEKSFWEPTTPDSPGLSLDMLLKERELDLESFLLQRQNVIPETSSQGILEKHIKYAWLPKKFNRLVLGIDLAVSAHDDSDATAFVMLGITDDCIYICDAREERIQGNMKKIDVIVEMWEARRGMCDESLIIATDRNRYSIALEGDLVDYIDESDDDFKNTHVEGVTSSGRGDKLDRITSHSSLFENGKIFFNKVADILPKIATEITDYNPLESNDLMDATEVGLYVSRQYLASELSIVN